MASFTNDRTFDSVAWEPANSRVEDGTCLNLASITPLERRNSSCELWTQPGVIKHGWKIPELNGRFHRKIMENHQFLWSIFQQAMFLITGDRRVNLQGWFCWALHIKINRICCSFPTSVYLVAVSFPIFDGTEMMFWFV